MVLLVDRSTSMDRPFAVRKVVDAAALGKHRSKGEVARELLSKFVAERRNDRFGMVVFSTFPIPVLRPTDHHEVVHASITAGDTGRGLAETNIGGGVEQALQVLRGATLHGRPDHRAGLRRRGRDQPDAETAHCASDSSGCGVSLYWIYIRSARGPVIFDSTESGGGSVDTEMTPERALHEFFSQMGSAATGHTPRRVRKTSSGPSPT